MKNELRIGNYVYDPINKENVKLVAIEQGNRPITLGSKGTSSFSGFDCLQPIPLTEEILLKCPQFRHNPIVKVATVFNMDLGRSRELTISCVGTPNLGVFITNKENGKTTDIVTIWNYDYDKELYLHQLQNLIHSLTNEELTVNL